MDFNKLAKMMAETSNNKPISDFEGLSANEMEILIYQPFTAQSPVRFKKEIKPELLSEIPFLLLVEAYLKYLSENESVKLTTIGNLPRVVIHHLYGLGFIKEDAIERGIMKLSKEDDSLTIQNTKIISEIAGLTTKRKGKLSISKRGQELLKNRVELFKEIFLTYCLKFNWSYHDGYGDNQIGQLGIGFILGLLVKYGKEEKDSKFYCDKYLKAFPRLMNNINDERLYPKEKRFHHCFSVRTFERFLNCFSIVELREENDDYYGKINIKKTSLIDEIFEAPKFKPVK